MYQTISALSSLIRLFILPDPFEALTVFPTVAISGVQVTLAPWILNLIAEPVLHFLTFMIAGIYYKDRAWPSEGSALYILFYAVHTILLMLAAKFNFSIIPTVAIIAVYITVHVVVNRCRNSFYL